jgi:putative colanic acid biosynthesis UDP-glucose lipid carrier transferase
MLETIRFIARVNRDQLSIAVMTPYLGTPIFEMAARGEGGYRLLASDWESFDKYSSGVLELESVRLGELKLLQLLAYLALYTVNGRLVELVRLIVSQWKMATAMLGGTLRDFLVPRKKRPVELPMIELGAGRKGAGHPEEQMTYTDPCLAILSAGILLILLSVPIALISLWVALDSEGGVFFVQTRIGMNGIPFRIYKFRTMYAHIDDAQPSSANRNDSRVTRVGSVLRPLGLDELPQLLNILKGEMAFVGPRPQLTLEMNAYIQGNEDLLLERASVRPGITSPWCISREQPKERPSLEMLRSDCEYVRNRSLVRDGAILIGTFVHLLQRIFSEE